MTRIAVVIAALLALQSTAYAESRYALVIGSNPGWSQDRPLRYAENDAERMRDVLVSLGNFASDRVTLLRDPTTADVRTALRRLATIASDNQDDDTLVFIYYSGHADDKFLHLRGAPLAFKELQDTIRALPATIKLGVIDACKSGAVTNKGGGVAEEFVVDVVTPKLSGMVLLSSSGADELSQESRALAGSVFTHHLVSGMRGAADEDDDRQVTIGEAYHYAYTRTRATTSSGAIRQRPAFRYELTGQGELVLTTLKSPRSVAAFVPKGEPQKYVVLDEKEWRVIAEVTAEKARAVAIALSPGRYRVKKVHDDRFEVGNLVVAVGDRPDLGKVEFQTMPLSAGIAKGDPTTLSPAERHEWSRGEAMRLLADGQAQAALVLFDQLLREDPADLSAWRGRGRAMVRLAEAYQRVGDVQRERRSLGEALRADPALSEDPMFAIWYQRLGELDARERSTQKRQFDLDQGIRKNPRTTKAWGVGLDLLSGRALLGISATKVISRRFFPRIGIDLAGPGIDGSITVAPMTSKWSPVVTVGVHASAKKLGLDNRAFEVGKGDMATTEGERYSSDEIWGYHVRVEAGAQFVSESGFTTELGLTMMVFKAQGKTGNALWPVFHFGWLW